MNMKQRHTLVENYSLQVRNLYFTYDNNTGWKFTEIQQTHFGGGRESLGSGYFIILQRILHFASTLRMKNQLESKKECNDWENLALFFLKDKKFEMNIKCIQISNWMWKKCVLAATASV